MPAGTILVAMDQRPGATGFVAYPEDYDGLERALVPQDERTKDSYWAYHLVFMLTDIGDLLEPLSPLEPRPDNRLPRRADTSS